MQTSDNKNAFSLRFLAELVAHQMFESIAVTFGLPLHGAGPVDALFGAFKGTLKHQHVTSFPHMQQLMAGRKGPDITLCELTQVLNLRDRVLRLLPFPPGLQDFQVWRIYQKGNHGVFLDVRQFLGRCTADELIDGGLVWRGAEDGKPLCLVPAGAAALQFSYVQPEFTEDTQLTIGRILDSPACCSAEERAWWRSFEARYAMPCASRSLAPLHQVRGLPFIDPWSPSDDAVPEPGLEQLVALLDTSFTDLRKVVPPETLGFWSNPAVKAKAARALRSKPDILRYRNWLADAAEGGFFGQFVVPLCTRLATSHFCSCTGRQHTCACNTHSCPHRGK